MIGLTRTGMESSRLLHTHFLDQALSPEMGMANSVDKALACSDYQEPDCSDEQEPKPRTIGTEEASHSSYFSAHYLRVMNLAFFKKPSKGPQKSSNALVRCLFQDSES